MSNVRISPDGENWTPSLEDCTVVPSGGKREVGEQHTMGSDVPILKIGKRGSMRLDVLYDVTRETTFAAVLEECNTSDDGWIHLQYEGGGSWWGTGVAVLRLHRPGIGRFAVVCPGLKKLEGVTQ